MADAGLIVLVSFISPFRAERQHGARAAWPTASSSRSSSTRRSRNAPGATRRASTRKALRGEIKNFTGVDSPYEAPENPEIHLKTLGKSPEEMVEALRTLASNERDIAEQQYDSGGGI